MNITIRHCIDQRDMRNPRDVGDYWEDKGGWQIRTSFFQNWRYELLVAVHEMVEFSLIQHRGIPETAVMRFDLENPQLDEPGADPRAPYFREHAFATAIERALAAELGVDWEEYGAAVFANAP